MKLRPEVQRFAEEMERQLQANEHKGGWEDCTQEFLLSELNKNKVRLLEAIYGHNPIRREEKILRRCANIANFAMMVADNWGGEFLQKKPKPEEAENWDEEGEHDD